MLELNPVKQVPLSLVADPTLVGKPSLPSQFVLWDLRLLLLGWFFDHFFLGVLLGRHLCNY